MDIKKILLISIITVVILASVSAVSAGFLDGLLGGELQDTNLNFKSNSTLTEGDSLKVKLTDANGTAIANQTVNITITDKDGSNDYHSVVTNENGTGKLKFDKSAGEYNVTVSYGGNDKYNPSNATKKITVEEEVATTPEVSQTTESYSNYNEREQVDYNSPDSNYYKWDTDGSYHEKQEGVNYVYAQDAITGEWSYWADKS